MNVNRYRDVRLQPDAIRSRLAELRCVTGLTDRDRVGLLILELARAAEVVTLAPGQVKRHAYNRCLLLAVDGLVRAIAPKRSRWLHGMRRICALFGRWNHATSELLSRMLAGNLCPGDQRRRVAEWQRIRTECGRSRDIGQFMKAAAYTEEILAIPGSLDEKPGKRDVDRVGLLALVQPNLNALMFVGDDGGIKLGQYQLRDAVGTELGLRRRLPGDPVQVELSVDRRVDKSPMPASAASNIEVLEVLDAIIERRHRDCVRDGRSRLREVVLRFDVAKALLSGERSLAEVAQAEGVSKGALHGVWEPERKGILAELARATNSAES